MNTLAVCVFACLAVYASAGFLGHAHVGAWDDGQWHGEGLLESQDWAGHHGAAIVAPGAAVIAPSAAAVVAHHGVHGVHGLHGLGLHGLGYHGVGIHGLGHGAVVAGPSGAIVADVVHGHLAHGHHGPWW